MGKRVRRSKEAPERNGRLIVRNISFKATKKALKEHFSKYGTVQEVNLLKKPDGKLVGCGYVHFSNVAMAEKAIAATNKKPFLGRPISVDWTVAKNKYMEHVVNQQIKIEKNIKKEDLDSDDDEKPEFNLSIDKIKDKIESESESGLKSDDDSEDGSDAKVNFNDEDGDEDEQDEDMVEEDSKVNVKQEKQRIRMEPTRNGEPLIVALAVATSAEGVITVTDQVLVERSLHTWTPSQLLTTDNIEVYDIEVYDEEQGVDLRSASEEVEGAFIPGDQGIDEDIEMEEIPSELHEEDQDSGSDEDEELTMEDLSIDSPEDLDDDTDAEDLRWSSDYSSFTGQRQIFQEVAGPKIEGTDPMSIFTQIWDQPLLELIVNETNEYAWTKITDAHERGLPSHSRLHQWAGTCVEEVYRLIAVMILMGICVRGRIDEYWSSGILGMREFRKLMTLDRFWLMMRFLHFVNNDSLASTIRGHERKIFKIKPLLDYLNAKFVDVYTPRQQISIDESLLLWKGHLSWTQCIRTKAARFGIKSYELCEAVTGYCVRVHIYTGKCSPSMETLYGFTSATAITVLKLLQGFLGKGYTLFMDNFYNSVALARFLKRHATDVVGTLNRRRAGTPLDIKEINERRIQRGDVVSRHCGDLSVVAWKDVRLVTMVSTYHNADMVQGQRAGQICQKPAVVKEYNKYMGGVDLKDQKLSMYLLERKRGIKWDIKVFRRLLNISILNAYIIYCANIGQNTKKLTHREFRYKLAIQLAQRSGTNSLPRTRSSEPCERLNVTLGHFPDHKEIAADARVAKQQVRYMRGRCARCAKLKLRKMSNVVCRQCNVFLCVGQCWLEYHTKENL